MVAVSVAFPFFSFHFKRIDFYLQLQGGGKSAAIERVRHGNQCPGGLVDFFFKAADPDRHFGGKFGAAACQRDGEGGDAALQTLPVRSGRPFSIVL